MRQNWNFMCAECHSTNLQKNYDAQKREYKTSWSEIKVSCEVCHGPGSGHIDWTTNKSWGERGDNRTKGSRLFLTSEKVFTGPQSRDGQRAAQFSAHYVNRNPALRAVALAPRSVVWRLTARGNSFDFEVCRHPENNHDFVVAFILVFAACECIRVISISVNRNHDSTSVP